MNLGYQTEFCEGNEEQPVLSRPKHTTVTDCKRLKLKWLHSLQLTLQKRALKRMLRRAVRAASLTGSLDRYAWMQGSTTRLPVGPRARPAVSADRELTRGRSSTELQMTGSPSVK